MPPGHDLLETVLSEKELQSFSLQKKKKSSDKQIGVDKKLAVDFSLYWLQYKVA